MTKLKDEIHIDMGDVFIVYLSESWGKAFHPSILNSWVHSFVMANAERGLSAVYRQTSIYWDCNRMVLRYEIMNHGKWLDEPRHQVDSPADWQARPDRDTPEEQEWEKLRRS